MLRPDATGTRLVGAVLFGDTADGLYYLDLIRSGRDISAERADIAFGRPDLPRSEPCQGGRVMGSDFSPEQKRYLEGFVAGIAATRASGGITGACGERRARAGRRCRADRPRRRRAPRHGPLRGRGPQAGQ